MGFDVERMRRVIRILPRLPQLIGRRVPPRLEPIINPLEPTHDRTEVLAERLGLFEREGLLSHAACVPRR
ncbi:MAG: hypothetical protein JWL69_4424 [Phycisphaerales bacterium]|nr:hypothetical protein [Phycisphaerales bacterium]